MTYDLKRAQGLVAQFSSTHSTLDTAVTKAANVLFEALEGTFLTPYWVEFEESRTPKALVGAARGLLKADSPRLKVELEGTQIVVVSELDPEGRSVVPIRFSAATSEFVATAVDEDIAPTPGERLPRKDGLVVLTESILACLAPS